VGLVTTIRLVIEVEPSRAPFVLGAIRGILPSVNRWATSAVVTVDQDETKGEVEK
jgi:hypothetical protein